MSSRPRLAKNRRGCLADGAAGKASRPNGNVITSRAPSSRMRCAMKAESLVHSVASRSTRVVSQRSTRLLRGATRMSEPQADAASWARTPSLRASHASVPCEVR